MGFLAAEVDIRTSSSSKQNLLARNAGYLHDLLRYVNLGINLNKFLTVWTEKLW